MLAFEVRRFLNRDGREIAVLIDRGGGRPFWPNVYVAAEYIRRGTSVNTSVKVLRTFGMARMWPRRGDAT